MPVHASRAAALRPIALTLAIAFNPALPNAGETSRAPSRAAVVVAETKHVAVRATLSASEPPAGAKISVTVDVTPKPKMHVYAPGGKYTPVTLRVEPQSFVKAGAVVYPQPRDYFFAPLKEHAQVYSDPFRLVLDVTIGDGKEAVPSPLTLKATLEYQACDDKLCYLPASIPLQWTVKVRR